MVQPLFAKPFKGKRRNGGCLCPGYLLVALARLRESSWTTLENALIKYSKPQWQSIASLCPIWTYPIHTWIHFQRCFASKLLSTITRSILDIFVLSFSCVRSCQRSACVRPSRSSRRAWPSTPHQPTGVVVPLSYAPRCPLVRLSGHFYFFGF